MKRKYWQSICAVVLLSASVGTTALASSSSDTSSSSTSEVSSTTSTTSSTDASSSNSDTSSTSTGTDTTASDTSTSGTTSSDTSSSTSSSTEGDISIPDALLKSAIYEELGLESSAEITKADFAELKTLSVAGVSDFTGLENATDLATLSITKSPNITKDFAFLSSLASLKSLTITDSEISDPSFLNTLKSLTTLNLDDNNIADISSLDTLTTTSISAIDQVVEESTSNQLTDGFQMKYPIVSFDGKVPVPSSVTPDTGKYDEDTSIISWETMPTGTTELNVSWEGNSTEESLIRNFSGIIKITYSASSSTSSTSSTSTSSSVTVPTAVSTPSGGESLPQTGEESSSIMVIVIGILVGFLSVIVLKRRKNTTN